MPPALNHSQLRFVKRNADEHRLWHGQGETAVYCGRVVYHPADGWDAQCELDHAYLKSGPYGHDKKAFEAACDALHKHIVRRNDLTDSWL